MYHPSANTPGSSSPWQDRFGEQRRTEQDGLNVCLDLTELQTGFFQLALISFSLSAFTLENSQFEVLPLPEM